MGGAGASGMAGAEPESTRVRVSSLPEQLGAFLRPGLLLILQGFLGGAMSGGQAANAFVDVVRRDWRLGGGVWFVGLYGLWSCRQALLTRRRHWWRC